MELPETSTENRISDWLAIRVMQAKSRRMSKSRFLYSAGEIAIYKLETSRV